MSNLLFLKSLRKIYIKINSSNKISQFRSFISICLMVTFTIQNHIHEKVSYPYSIDVFTDPNNGSVNFRKIQK